MVCQARRYDTVQSQGIVHSKAGAVRLVRGKEMRQGVIQGRGAMVVTGSRLEPNFSLRIPSVRSGNVVNEQRTRITSSVSRKGQISGSIPVTFGPSVTDIIVKGQVEIRFDMDKG